MRVEVDRLRWVLASLNIGKLFGALGFSNEGNVTVACDINGTRILEQGEPENVNSECG